MGMSLRSDYPVGSTDPKKRSSPTHLGSTEVFETAETSVAKGLTLAILK